LVELGAGWDLVHLEVSGDGGVTFEFYRSIMSQIEGAEAEAQRSIVLLDHNAVNDFVSDASEDVLNRFDGLATRVSQH